jgi:hypothetical protein
MPSPQQSGPNGRQRRPHALLHREANDLEPTLAIGSAAMRESQEVKRLRMTLTPAPTVLDGESTKLDQPRLVRVQCQSEFREPLLQVVQKLPRRLLPLERYCATLTTKACAFSWGGILADDPPA